MVITHLPDGPTAHFKLSNLKFRKEIKVINSLQPVSKSRDFDFYVCITFQRSGEPTDHKPEVILNNFNTRLGLSVGRMLAALFPHEPQFHGRRVVTFHNQRDFIFVRHHRYQFRNNKRCGLQELGPRFTLKLRSLQKGTFDSKFGEYEWIHKVDFFVIEIVQ